MLAATLTTTLPTTLPESPYRGIEPFRYVDQPIFFARKDETEKLLRYVAVYRGVLFYGSSGSGKSSLLNAGFIPAAIAEGFIPDRLRVQPRRNEEIIVERIAADNAGAVYLPSNFARDEDPSPRVVFSVSAFERAIETLPAGRRPLLIFEQFEEFVTLFEEPSAGETLKEIGEAQDAILRLLVRLLRSQALPLKILLVFREDYLAKFTKLFTLYPNLPDQYLRLTPPRTDVLDEIILGPFRNFPRHFRRELPPDLATRLITALSERSELGVLNLSEVQITCLRLWQSSDPVSLFNQKGVGGLLEDYLSEALDTLEDRLRDPATALLSHMVTSAGTRNVISEEDLINWVHNEERISQGLLAEALVALVEKTKLVRRERRRDTYFYEIISEFLIPKIKQQKEARAKRLARNERRKRLGAYVLAGISLLMAAVSIYYFFEARRADNEGDIQRKKNQESLNSINKLTEENKSAQSKLEEAQISLGLSKTADAQMEISQRKQNELEIIYYSTRITKEVLDDWTYFGFKLIPKPESEIPKRAVNLKEIPVNAISFGSKVTPEDIKIVALGLRKSEFTLRLIYQEPNADIANKIVVRGDDNFNGCPVIPTDEIFNAKAFLQVGLPSCAIPSASTPSRSTIQ